MLSKEKWREILAGPVGTPKPGGRWWDEINAVNAFESLVTDFLQESREPYVGHTKPRGVVICGGGQKLFTNAWVNVQQLRARGCNLPVELWHLPNEISPFMADLIAPLGVVCVDAHRLQEEKPARVLNGWELKAYAIKYSKFREVLLLDADNTVVKNPEFLFETPEFLETGAIFWPDYQRLDADRLAWKMVNVPYRDEPEFESGQIVVDRQRAWRPLARSMMRN